MTTDQQTLRCGDRVFHRRQKTLVMGIINLSPDSFSDGGKLIDTKSAVDYGQQLLDEGADILDVGGVSTAPHRPQVEQDEETRRVIPVIMGLKNRGITNISIDTMRADVAARALHEGASWINDQSAGLIDENMPSIMRRADAVVLMHNGGGITSGVGAGEAVFYDDVVLSISSFFSKRIDALTRDGVDISKIIVDPGIGFGKGQGDTKKLIKNMHKFARLNVMTLVGISRKSFLEKLSGKNDPRERDVETLAASAIAIMSGCDMIRTHNVKAMVEMTRVIDGIMKG